MRHFWREMGVTTKRRPLIMVWGSNPDQKVGLLISRNQVFLNFRSEPPLFLALHRSAVALRARLRAAHGYEQVIMYAST